LKKGFFFDWATEFVKKKCEKRVIEEKQRLWLCLGDQMKGT
jgi:hypothetical protein